MELWDDEGFNQVGSAIGEPLFMDRLTEEKKRTDYARICIEVQADTDFSDIIPVVIDHKKEINIPIEYNWKPPRCIHCVVFGHTVENCNKINPEQKAKAMEWVQKQREKNMSGRVKNTAEGVAINPRNTGPQTQGNIGRNPNPTLGTINNPTTPVSILIPPSTASTTTNTPTITNPSIPNPTPNPTPAHNPNPLLDTSSITPHEKEGEWQTPAKKHTIRSVRSPTKAPKRLQAPLNHEIGTVGTEGTPANESSVTASKSVTSSGVGIVNPFEHKPGMHLSFEDNLARSRKRMAWEEERKKTDKTDNDTTTERQKERSKAMTEAECIRARWEARQLKEVAEAEAEASQKKKLDTSSKSKSQGKHGKAKPKQLITVEEHVSEEEIEDGELLKDYLTTKN